MKTRIFAAIASIALFASCQKDVSPELFQNTNTESNLNELDTDCKACAYYPLCDSSIYNYSERGGGLFTSLTIGKPSTYMVQFVSDSTIDGNMYKKMKTVNGQVGFFDCTNGVTTQLVFFTNPLTQVLSVQKTTILKANEPVAATWSDTLTISNTQKEYYNYTILEKGISRAVGGIMYDDVIKIKKHSSTFINGVTTLSTDYLELFYARGTGLIETKSISTVGMGSINYHRILTSAIIPE
jgi:hypothetical protein